jgi:hypothetical protein
MSLNLSKKTYVYYICRPLIDSPVDTMHEVDARDPQQAIADMPEDAIAFYYFDVISTVVEVDGRAVELKSGGLNRTKEYYVDAKLLNLEQVKALPGSHDEWLDRMKVNEWSRVIVPRIPSTIVSYRPNERELIESSDESFVASSLQALVIGD